MSLSQEEPLRGFVYVSEACPEMGQEAVDRLVERSALNNQKTGVTGILCYKRGRFLQYFEGPDEVATGLMQRIDADERHKVVRSIEEFPVSSRRFSTWSMRLMGDQYLANIALEDIAFSSVSLQSVDDPTGEWWKGLAWRIVERLAKLHAKQNA